MDTDSILQNPHRFSEVLFEKMVQINPGLEALELYEFRYALDNISPDQGWAFVETESMDVIQNLICQKEFFTNIQLKPVKNNRIVLDESILHLTQVLCTGIVTGLYPVDWVKSLFYFDIRGFIFFVRTNYFNKNILDHFGGAPYRQFVPAQNRFDSHQEIGYKEIKAVNHVTDQAFINTILQLIEVEGTPILLTLVGPSAAGKTEIVERLRSALAQENKNSTSIEMDNFFKDREYRDGKAMGLEVIHFELFKESMTNILQGQKISIPRYDFYQATSSHDMESHLRPGRSPLEIEPADIILLEGNFPFHLPEIAHLAGIKIVYLTDDPIRLKRKWKRDIDYRKKYDPVYLCNRYFRTQYLRAIEVYLPLMEVSDVVVDTTGAALWVKPDIAARLYQPTTSK